LQGLVDGMTPKASAGILGRNVAECYRL
jgi:hypothetical protein